ncbi:preprotein translocase subunit YajC [Propionibacteriaceae bacterium Y1685]
MDPNTLTTIAMIALMIVAFYFLILRPQRKRQADQAKTLESLTPGSRVLTSTGIYGNLVRIGDKQAVIELAPGHEMTLVKHAIVRVVQPGEEDLESEGLSTLGGGDAVSNGDDDVSAPSTGSSNWQEFPVGGERADAAADAAGAGDAYPSYAPKESESVQSESGSTVEGEVSDSDVDGTKRN